MSDLLLQHQAYHKWVLHSRVITFSVYKMYLYDLSGAILMQSSRWAPVLRPMTSKTLFRPVHFSNFYLDIYKNKFQNLIRTSKFKFSFQGLLMRSRTTINVLYHNFCLFFPGFQAYLFLLVKAVIIWSGFNELE